MSLLRRLRAAPDFLLLFLSRLMAGLYRGVGRFVTIAVLTSVVLVVMAARSPAQAVTPRFYTELEFPPLPEIQVPDYERYELDNGLVIYLAEDHELPLVSGTALIRAGEIWEPADQVGLASVVGEVMRSGGTTQHPAAELNQLLEQRAASVETGIGAASGSASFSGLSEDLPDILGLFAEVLRAPAFAPDQIDLTLSQFAGSIARQNDDPGNIAGRVFDQLIYGADNPYARVATYATLAEINRDRIVEYYQQFVQPDRIMLGIVGDFDPTVVKALITENFGDWVTTATPPAPTVPAATQATTGGVYLVDQPQLTQSSVRVGHLGGTLDNPAYPALSVLNGVMNRFGGRLNNELRSRQGLAYSVYASWSPNFSYPGLFIGGGETRSETTVPFVTGLTQEIDRVRQEPLSAEELAYSKESVLNSFIFNFQTPGQTLSRLMRYEYFGYPADFVFQYQTAVEQVTAADVLQAAQTELHPDRLVTLIVGNAAAIDPPLSTLSPDGQVTAIDVSIPPPPESAALSLRSSE